MRASEESRQAYINGGVDMARTAASSYRRMLAANGEAPEDVKLILKAVIVGLEALSREWPAMAAAMAEADPAAQR